MSALMKIVLPVVYIVYIVLGGVAFHFLERENENTDTKKVTERQAEFLENRTCITEDELRRFMTSIIAAYEQGLITRKGEPRESNDQSWSLHKSVYFSTTVVSTIGYGNISPVTTWGRLFCVIFAIIGIPLALIVYGHVGIALDKFIAFLVGKCVKDKNSKKMKIIRSVINIIAGIIIFIFIPPVGFMQKEDWTYFEGVYYAFITLTTIGFGDYVAGFEEREAVYYYILVNIWIVVGLAWMSSLVSNLYEIVNHEVQDVFDAIAKKRASSVHHGDSEVEREKSNGNLSTKDVDIATPDDDSCTIGALDLNHVNGESERL